LILEQLLQNNLQQMHTADLTGKPDQDIVSILTNAGTTVQKWDQARKNQGPKALL
jgi:hypothetical protein